MEKTGEQLQQEFSALALPLMRWIEANYREESFVITKISANEATLDEKEAEQPARPKHYEGKIDVFDFCYAQGITDPCVVHALSYQARLGKKEGVTIAEDLRKAINCLQRALAHYEGLEQQQHDKHTGEAR